jgi:hypothetical protein
MQLSQTNWIFLILGAMAFSLAFVQITYSNRWRREEIADRREMRMREERRERRQAEQEAYDRWSREQLQRVLIAEQQVADAPAMPGEYFTFVFDLGADIRKERFEELFGEALKLPVDLARMANDESRVELQIHRVNYQNPLTVTMIVTGPIAAVAWAARRINAAIQEMRQSWAETREVKAGHDHSAATHELQRELTEVLTAMIHEEDPLTLQKTLRRVERVAKVATDTGLLSVSQRSVNELEAGENRASQVLARRPRLLALEGGDDDPA